MLVTELQRCFWGFLYFGQRLALNNYTRYAIKDIFKLLEDDADDRTFWVSLSKCLHVANCAIDKGGIRSFHTPTFRLQSSWKRFWLISGGSFYLSVSFISPFRVEQLKLQPQHSQISEHVCGCTGAVKQFKKQTCLLSSPESDEKIGISVISSVSSTEMYLMQRFGHKLPARLDLASCSPITSTSLLSLLSSLQTERLY